MKRILIETAIAASIAIIIMLALTFQACGQKAKAVNRKGIDRMKQFTATNLTPALIEIESLSTGLNVVSETDADVHAFIAPRPVTSFTSSTFLESIVRPSTTPISVENFDDWIDNQIAVGGNASQWNAMRDYLEGVTENCVIFKVGSIQLDTYGACLYQGRILGFRTFMIAT